MHDATLGTFFLKETAFNDQQQVFNLLSRLFFKGFELQTDVSQAFCIAEKAEWTARDIMLPHGAWKGFRARSAHHKRVVMIASALLFVFFPSHGTLILHHPGMVVIRITAQHHERILIGIEGHEQYYRQADDEAFHIECQ